jgi:hypothetical protein
LTLDANNQDEELEILRLEALKAKKNKKLKNNEVLENQNRIISIETNSTQAESQNKKSKLNLKSVNA